MQTKPPKKPKAMRYFSFNFIYMQRTGFKVAQVWYRRLLPPSAHIRHMLKCINKPAFCWVSPLLATSLHFVTGGHNSTWSDCLALAGLAHLFTRSSALLLGAKEQLLIAFGFPSASEGWAVGQPMPYKGKKGQKYYLCQLPRKERRYTLSGPIQPRAIGRISGRVYSSHHWLPHGL